MVFLFSRALVGGASVLASRLVPSSSFFKNHPAIISNGRAELPLCPNKKRRREFVSSNNPIKVVAYHMSNPLSPPNGERAGVRGKHLKTKRLLPLLNRRTPREKTRLPLYLFSDLFYQAMTNNFLTL
jgi:hypothetical protein